MTDSIVNKVDYHSTQSGNRPNREPRKHSLISKPVMEPYNNVSEGLQPNGETEV